MSKKLSGIFASGVIKSIAKNFDRENKNTGEVNEGKYRVQIEIETPQAEGVLFENITLGTDSPDLYRKYQGQYVPLIFIKFGSFNDRLWYKLDDEKNIDIFSKSTASTASTAS